MASAECIRCFIASITPIRDEQHENHFGRSQPQPPQQLKSDEKGSEELFAFETLHEMPKKLFTHGVRSCQIAEQEQHAERGDNSKNRIDGSVRVKVAGYRLMPMLATLGLTVGTGVKTRVRFVGEWLQLSGPSIEST